MIISYVLFRYTRSLKLNLHTGPTNEIKYICINCKRHVESNSLETHLLTDCRPNNKYTCTTCQEIFKNLQQYLKHEETHEKLLKTGIVTFNDPADKTFNDNLIVKDSLKTNLVTKVKIKSNLNVKDHLISKDKRYTIFKCAKCDICVFMRHSVERHKCGGKKLCKICNQYYSNKIYPHHLALHIRKPYINKKTLKVVLFRIVNGKAIMDETLDDNCFGKGKGKSIEFGKNNPVGSKLKDLKNSIDLGKDSSFTKDKNKSFNVSKDTSLELSKDKPSKVKNNVSKEKDKKSLPFNDDNQSYWVISLKDQTHSTAKIFRCVCNLHFTSLTLIQEHLYICENNPDISKEMCSKCNLYFPTEILVTHLCKHHSKDIQIDVENVKKNIFFECSKCTLIFTSTDLFDTHLENCNVGSFRNCNTCQLKFHRNSYENHSCSAKEVDVTYLNKIIVLKNDYMFSTVFQCVECNINYLNRKSFKYHVVDVNHESKCQLTICEFCGLQFTSYSSHHHYEIHSKLGQYKIKIVDPVNGNHSYIDGVNVKTLTDSTKRRSSSKKVESPVKKIKIEETSVNHGHNTRHSEKVNNSNTDLDVSKSDLNDTSMKSDLSINDSINESSEIDKKEPLSKKLKARILLDKYDNNLYRCMHCDQHYLKYASLEYHVTTFDHRVKPELFKCDDCGLDFSRYTLPRHKYVHHYHMKLKREDIVVISDLPKDLNVKEKNLEENMKKDDTLIAKDSTEKKGNQKIKSTKNVENTEITYYKCTDCNVCFLTKRLCYKHTKRHEILDPKMYIQCKICEFQFLIDSLKNHMDSHHKIDFRIENLKVVEYKPLGDDLEPKIDSYMAVDKVQSRLVSSTDGVV